MSRISIGLLSALLILLIPTAVLAEGIVLFGPDTTDYPIVSVVVRATDAKGHTLHNLDGVFTIQETVGNQPPRSDVRPEVTPLQGGQPIAFTLLLETRNETTREDLNATRDFMRHFVQVMPYAVPGPLFEDADLIELWVPGQQSGVVVPFAAVGFQPVALENAINQVLPYAGDSASLGSLLEQIISAPSPGSQPRVVILAGRFANIDPSVDAPALASAANLHNVTVYAVPINSDTASTDFLRRLAVATGGKLVEPVPVNAEFLRDEIFQRYKGQYLLRFSSAFTPSGGSHIVEVRADAPTGNARQDIRFIPSTRPIPEPMTRMQGILAILILVVLFGLLLMGIAASGLGIRVQGREKGAS